MNIPKHLTLRRRRNSNHGPTGQCFHNNIIIISSSSAYQKGYPSLVDLAGSEKFSPDTVNVFRLNAHYQATAAAATTTNQGKTPLPVAAAGTAAVIGRYNILLVGKTATART